MCVWLLTLLAAPFAASWSHHRPGPADLRDMAALMYMPQVSRRRNCRLRFTPAAMLRCALSATRYLMPSAIRPSQVTLLYHRESILAAYRDMSSADQSQTRLASRRASMPKQRRQLLAFQNPRRK